MAESRSAAVAEPREETKKRPQKQPKYHVVLWDDNDHTYDYVIRLMKEVFHFEQEKGYLIAKAVDTQGRVICLTTTREHAELKRDQIHAYGKDPLMPRCQGSMYATIEPEE